MTYRVDKHHAASYYRGMSNQIRHYRRKKNLTQAELGQLMSPSVGQSTIANYENEQRKPDLDTLRQIARLLETTVDDLCPPDEIEEAAA